MTFSVAWFAVAVALLFGAHVLRCYRQTLLFPNKLLPWRFDLLLALSLSHFFNVLLPWRAGELIRIGFVSMRYHLRPSYVAATVLAERLSDIAVVVFVASALLLAGRGPSSALSALVTLLAGAGLGVLAMAVLVGRFAAFRRLVWWLASVFNDRLRFLLVDLAWSFSQLVLGRYLLRRPFLVLSLAMWALYFASYWAFAYASGSSLMDVSLTLLGGPNRPLLQQIIESGVGNQAAALFAFTALPVVGVLLYGLFSASGQLVRMFTVVRLHGFSSLDIGQPIAGDRFSDREDYAAFLQSQFTGAKAVVSSFGLIASTDVLVLKLLPGGSDAVTALVEDASGIKIRKCAAAAAGDKLAEQAAWLRLQADELPLAPVIGESRTAATYSYDMPYLITARDFYEMIHTAPIGESERIIRDVVETMDRFHTAHAMGTAPEHVVDGYLRRKVLANAEQVHAFASVVFEDGRYTVNGVNYALDEWKPLFDLDWLHSQVRRRATADVHGDLTIENIIVSSEVERGWYVIDPNPDNIFNTPLIDWAKLMQSLHLGYEGLNRGAGSVISARDIKLLFLRSDAYSSLHEFLGRHLSERLGQDGMKEVAFHEIVNYLRLTPYKIRHQPEKALTFFACTSVLLRRYLAAGWTMPVDAMRRAPASDATAWASSPSR